MAPPLSITRRPIRPIRPAEPVEPAKPVLPDNAVQPAPVQPTALSRSDSLKSGSSTYSETPGFARSLSNSSGETKDSLSGVDSEAGVPPVPPKADIRQPLRQLPKNPRPQNQTSVVRRRSLKSERTPSTPDLKLASAPTPLPPQQPLPQRSLPTAPSQLPKSPPLDRKPVPLDAPTQPGLMGSKTSKLKDKAQRALEGSRSDDTTPQPQTTTQVQPPFQRLGTPEHLKSDPQQQSSFAPQLFSSLSDQARENFPSIPLKSDSRNDNNPSALASVTSRPNLLSPSSRSPNEPLTISSDPAIKFSPQPRPPPSRILSPRTSPSSTSDPFPGAGPPLAAGTVIAGPPLTVVHLDCYQSHRLMRSSRNAVCPVACMICHKKDAELRWRCAWCCVSACAGCMQLMSATPGKDLRVCVKKVAA